LSAGFSAPHFAHSIVGYPARSLSKAFAFQVGGVEAFGEPVVDIGEHRARLVATTRILKQPREAHGRP
jgi:hypothetical protein